MLIFRTYWKAQSANCSRNRRNTEVITSKIWKKENRTGKCYPNFIKCQSVMQGSGNKKHLEAGNHQSHLQMQELSFKNSPLPRKWEGLDIPEGGILLVSGLMVITQQLPATRNKTEPQNKSCLRCQFSLKPDPNLGHHSQVLLNSEWHRSKTFTGLTPGPLSLKTGKSLIYPLKHELAFKTRFWTWWLYTFLTFSLQMRHRDMTVLTLWKPSRYSKLECIRQIAGLSNLTKSTQC